MQPIHLPLSRGIWIDIKLEENQQDQAFGGDSGYEGE